MSIDSKLSETDNIKKEVAPSPLDVLSSFPEVSKETKEELTQLELDRMNDLFNKLLRIEITSSNYETFKKDFKELLEFLNNNKNLILETGWMPTEDLLEYVKQLWFKLIKIISIKKLLKKLSPDYKWNNILELTGNENLNQDYMNFLNYELKRRYPQEKLEKIDIIDVEPDEKRLIDLVKSIHEKY